MYSFTDLIHYLRARFHLRRIRCISREESASPATGSAAAHKLESTPDEIQEMLARTGFPAPARS